MSSRWIGFFIWALVAASAASWGVKIFAAARPIPDGASAPLTLPKNSPMERLFGPVVQPVVAAAPVHPESERFQLLGVIAPPAGGHDNAGVAIVAIDGQPARPWHVGATLDGGTALLAVARRTADFGPAGGPVAFTLQLPEPTAPVTGTLAAATPKPGPQLRPGVLPDPGMQSDPQRENAQHVAQPQPPGLNRGVFGQGARGGLRSRRPDAPPSGVAAAPADAGQPPPQQR